MRACYVLCLVAFLAGLKNVPTEGRRRGAMSYVVQRGCPYLAHYVRNNYYDYAKVRRQRDAITMTTLTPPSTTSHLNWVTYLYDRLREDYVPQELFKGLMECGKEYAMYAIDAPADIISTLNIQFHSVPGLG